MSKQIKKNKKNQKQANKQRIMRSKQIPTKKTNENKEHKQTQKTKNKEKQRAGAYVQVTSCVFFCCAYKWEAPSLSFSLNSSPIRRHL
jgi:hypothetical protein